MGISGESMTSRLLAACLLLLGVSALFGGGALVLDPSGDRLGMSLTLLEGTPFRDFLIPGAILSIVLGVGPLLALAGLLGQRAWSRSAAVATALALLAWITIQVLMIGYASWLQPLYAALGLVILVLALRLEKGTAV
jgi:hypothetical protein